MENEYSSVANALSLREINCYFQNEDQLVVSRQQGPAWPNAGNSFWISFKGGNWFLCTWAQYCYQLTNNNDIIDLCSTFVDRGTSAKGQIDDDLIASYSLRLLSDSDASQLFGWDLDETGSGGDLL